MSSAELKRYQLVEFIHEKQADGKKMIDCVPSKWIKWDAEHASLVTKFMPPPYGASRCKTLTMLIESNAEAPVDWPTYLIALNGDANTYDIGQKRMNKLRDEAYAYSTDCDQNGEERARDTLNCIKQSQFKDKLDKNLWDVPTLKGDTVAVLESSYTESSESDAVEARSENSTSDVCRTLFKKKPPQFKKNSKSPKKKNKVSNGGFGFKTTKPLKKMHRSPRLAISKSQIGHHDANDHISKSPLKDNLNLFEETEVSSDNSFGKTWESQKKKSLFKKTNSKSSEISPIKISPTRSRIINSPPKIGTACAIADKKIVRPRNSSSTTIVSMKKKELIANRNERRQESRFHADDSVKHTQSGVFKPSEESRQFRSIQADLESVKADIQNVHREVRNLRSVIETLSYKMTSQKSLKTFAEQHNVILPIEDLDLFQKFLEKLEDPDFQKAFIASLDILIDPEQSIIKSISAITRKHISRELAMRCTAVKPSGDKLVLKSTQFCKCICQAFELKNQAASMKSPCTEKKILKVLGSVLGNSKDWDGHRLHRAKNN